MPIQMVLRDVQHRSRCGFKAFAAVQLETRQLQNPDLGQSQRYRVLHRSGSHGQRLNLFAVHLIEIVDKVHVLFG